MNKKIELQDANKKIVEIFTSVLGNGATTYDLKQAFEKEKKIENIRLDVLNFVRDELKQYDMVATEIMSKNFNVTGLSKDVVNKLIKAIETNSVSGIKNLINANSKIKNRLKENGVTVDKFVEKLSKIQSNLIEAKNPDQIKQLAKKYNIKPEDLEKQLNKNIITFSVKKALFDEFVDANVDNKGEIKDSSKFSSDMENELNLYSDIE
jgi:hypothetical protein